MVDPLREFGDAANAEMEKAGFMLFKRETGVNRDMSTFVYCKMNDPRHTSITVTGVELLRSTSLPDLAKVRAESAIIKYGA